MEKKTKCHTRLCSGTCTCFFLFCVWGREEDSRLWMRWQGLDPHACSTARGVVQDAPIRFPAVAFQSLLVCLLFCARFHSVFPAPAVSRLCRWGCKGRAAPSLPPNAPLSVVLPPRIDSRFPFLFARRGRGEGTTLTERVHFRILWCRLCNCMMVREVCGEGGRGVSASPLSFLSPWRATHVSSVARAAQPSLFMSPPLSADGLFLPPFEYLTSRTLCITCALSISPAHTHTHTRAPLLSSICVMCTPLPSSTQSVKQESGAE